jgi:uncharacterized protein YciI
VRAFAVIGRDGPDPSRRAALRDRHIASIEQFARDGTLILGLPLHSPQGRSEGSLMIVAAADQAALDGYLAREPFAAGGVWQDISCRPLAIPSLPWRAWPAAGAALPPGRGHTILVLDGDAQPARLGDAAASGLLVFAAETLDAPGAILVTAHRDDAAALDFVAADPVLRRCGTVLHATLFRPLAYRPLP